MTAHRFQLIVIFLLILSDLAVATYCSEELMDVEKEAHIVVGKCRNTGTFSIGGFYDGTWERLTYYYPQPWEGTFLSIYVNGKVYSNSANPSSVRLDRSSLMDLYIEEPPHKTEDTILVKWRLPENVVVEEVFEIMENGTRLYIKIANENHEDVVVGARLHLDTMLGENDGAPIYIPGDGLKANETEYVGQDLNFRYWKAYNKGENATVIASGVLYGEGLDYPDKFLVTDWKKSMYSSWDYKIDSKRTILGDSSVLIYYNPEILPPNETRTIGTVYKNGGPVLPFSKGPLGIADIVSSDVGEKYAPGENVTISVDVVARDIENDTNIIVDVVDKNGTIIYTYNTTEDFISPDTVNPVKFNLKIPENFKTNDSVEIIASIFKGGEKVDEKRKRFSIVNASEKDFLRLDDVRIGRFGEQGFPIEVDVKSTALEGEGTLRFKILSGGKIIYFITKSTGTVPPNRVKTLNFTWTPYEITPESIILVVSLYMEYRKVDEITREFPFRFRLNDIRVGERGERGFPIEVDVVSVGIENRGDLGLEIMREGEKVYDSMKSTGTVAPNTVKTLNFTWKPEEPIPESIVLIVSLYMEYRKIDEIAQEFPLGSALNESAALNESVTPPAVEEDDEPPAEDNSHLLIISFILSTPLIIIFLFLNPVTRDRSIETGLMVYDEMEERGVGKDYIPKINKLVKRLGLDVKLLGFVKERRLRDVEIEKMRDGENIRLGIRNKGRRELRNCVVEDKIPRGIDVAISPPSTFGEGGGLIIIKSNKFVWDIGKLSPGASVVLEYRIRGSGALLPAKFRCDFGEKTTG